MHTLARNAHHNERLIYDFLEKAYPNRMPSFEELVNDNIINGTQLIELAVSKVDGIPLCENGEHRDLIDDSDVKTVTVQKSIEIARKTLKNGKRRRYKVIRYRAAIRDVHKKIGVLRIICYNPFTENYHYFRVPPNAIFGVRTLSIAFDKDTQKPIGTYAQYEVDSFEKASEKLTEREYIGTVLCNINKENVESSIDKILNLIETKEQLSIK